MRKLICVLIATCMLISNISFAFDMQNVNGGINLQVSGMGIPGKGIQINVDMAVKSFIALIKDKQGDFDFSDISKLQKQANNLDSSVEFCFNELVSNRKKSRYGIMVNILKDKKKIESRGIVFKKDQAGDVSYSIEDDYATMYREVFREKGKFTEHPGQNEIDALLIILVSSLKDKEKFNLNDFEKQYREYRMRLGFKKYTSGSARNDLKKLQTKGIVEIHRTKNLKYSLNFSFDDAIKFIVPALKKRKLTSSEIQTLADMIFNEHTANNEIDIEEPQNRVLTDNSEEIWVRELKKNYKELESIFIANDREGIVNKGRYHFFDEHLRKFPSRNALLKAIRTALSEGRTHQWAYNYLRNSIHEINKELEQEKEQPEKLRKEEKQKKEFIKKLTPKTTTKKASKYKNGKSPWDALKVINETFLRDQKDGFDLDDFKRAYESVQGEFGFESLAENWKRTATRDLDAVTGEGALVKTVEKRKGDKAKKIYYRFVDKEQQWLTQLETHFREASYHITDSKIEYLAANYLNLLEHLGKMPSISAYEKAFSLTKKFNWRTRQHFKSLLNQEYERNYNNEQTQLKADSLFRFKPGKSPWDTLIVIRNTGVSMMRDGFNLEQYKEAYGLTRDEFKFEELRSDTTTRKDLDDLVEAGFLKKRKDKKEGDKVKKFYYTYIKDEASEHEAIQIISIISKIRDICKIAYNDNDHVKFINEMNIFIKDDIIDMLSLNMYYKLVARFKYKNLILNNKSAEQKSIFQKFYNELTDPNVRKEIRKQIKNSNIENTDEYKRDSIMFDTMRVIERLVVQTNNEGFTLEDFSYFEKLMWEERFTGDPNLNEWKKPLSDAIEKLVDLGILKQTLKKRNRDKKEKIYYTVNTDWQSIEDALYTFQSVSIPVKYEINVRTDNIVLNSLLELGENIENQDSGMLLFDEDITFGTKEEPGISAFLPRIAKADVSVGVIATTEAQKKVVEKMNTQLPEEKQIKVYESVDIAAMTAKDRIFFYSNNVNAVVPQNVELIAANDIVAKIIAILGKIYGVDMQTVIATTKSIASAA